LIIILRFFFTRAEVCELYGWYFKANPLYGDAGSRWALGGGWGVGQFVWMFIFPIIGLMLLWFSFTTAKWLWVRPFPNPNRTTASPSGFLMKDVSQIKTSDGAIIIEGGSDETGYFPVLEVTVSENCTVCYTDFGPTTKRLVEKFDRDKHLLILHRSPDLWLVNATWGSDGEVATAEITGIFENPNAAELVVLRKKELAFINFSLFLIALGIIPVFLIIRDARRRHALLLDRQ